MGPAAAQPAFIGGLGMPLRLLPKNMDASDPSHGIRSMHALKGEAPKAALRPTEHAAARRPCRLGAA